MSRCCSHFEGGLDPPTGSRELNLSEGSGRGLITIHRVMATELHSTNKTLQTMRMDCRGRRVVCSSLMCVLPSCMLSLLPVRSAHEVFSFSLSAGLEGQAHVPLPNTKQSNQFNFLFTPTQELSSPHSLSSKLDLECFVQLGGEGIRWGGGSALARPAL